MSLAHYANLLLGRVYVPPSPALRSEYENMETLREQGKLTQHEKAHILRGELNPPEYAEMYEISKRSVYRILVRRNLKESI